jgi:hypothetical protein
MKWRLLCGSLCGILRRVLPNSNAKYLKGYSMKFGNVNNKVWDSVWDSVRGSVGDSVVDSISGPVWDFVEDSISGPVWDFVQFKSQISQRMQDEIR